MEEILHHLGCIKPCTVKRFQLPFPQLVIAGFLNHQQYEGLDVWSSDQTATEDRCRADLFFIDGLDRRNAGLDCFELPHTHRNPWDWNIYLDFTINKDQADVGKYTIHGSFGDYNSLIGTKKTCCYFKDSEGFFAGHTTGSWLEDYCGNCHW